MSEDLENLYQARFAKLEAEVAELAKLQPGPERDARRAAARTESARLRGVLQALGIE